MRENIPVIRLMTKGGILAARDGVVICFFTRRSHPEIAQEVWRALQTYLRAIPSQSLAWYVSEDGDMLPLDDKGWSVIQRRLLDDHPERAGWIAELLDNPSEAGNYHFEYYGRRLDHPLFMHDDDSSCGIAFSFPTEYLLEHGPGHMRALALELARELPFSFGYASLAFVSPGELWYSARQELMGLLSRYLGFDLYSLGATSRVIGTRARGAYWLTFLGQPLLGQLGGVEGLRAKLAFPEVSFEPMEGERLLITLGEWPDAIDVEKGIYLAQYATLAHLLEPFMYEERSGWFTPLNKDNMHRWLRRLCQ